MGEITITDLEETTLMSLKKVAESNGRSPEEEAALLICLGLSYSEKLTRYERAAAISAMTPKGVIQTDSVEIIREMREERDRDLGC